MNTVYKDVEVKLKNGKSITTNVKFIFTEELFGADGNRGMWMDNREEDYVSNKYDDKGDLLSSEEFAEYEALLESTLEEIDVPNQKDTGVDYE
jgi:hypothetical protein